MKQDATIDQVRARAYKIPAESPESDGTLAWDATTIVIVHIRSGDTVGIGYSYTHAAAVRLIEDKLAPQVIGLNALDTIKCWQGMVETVRNLGQTGLCMMAVAAVDSAVWDLKAKLLELPLVKLLGQYHAKMEGYGSGGFTSYSLQRLQQQLGGWAEAGFQKMKMKIGRHPDHDPERIKAARAAIRTDCELFVDANGAYQVKQALKAAQLFKDMDVTWFEEPVRHRDFNGLRRVRDSVSGGINVTAGEYGFELTYFDQMLKAGAVDILQADATRCGITGFLQAADLCMAANIHMSSHCAPSVHLHVCCSLEPVIHMEYFYDHARIERMLFDGAAVAKDGWLEPNVTRTGIGIELKEEDAEPYRID